MAEEVKENVGEGPVPNHQSPPVSDGEQVGVKDGEIGDGSKNTGLNIPEVPVSQPPEVSTQDTSFAQ